MTYEGEAGMLGASVLEHVALEGIALTTARIGTDPHLWSRLMVTHKDIRIPGREERREGGREGRGERRRTVIWYQYRRAW